MKNQLKIFRAIRNWSQADLGKHLGVSRQTVNAIETAKRAPSLPLAFKISRLFDLPIEEIFYDEPDKGKAPCMRSKRLPVGSSPRER